MVKPCTCKHTFQDEKYGPGRRVHNDTKPDSAGKPQVRCSVCGTQTSRKEQGGVIKVVSKKKA